MKLFKILFIYTMVLFAFSSAAVAGDFDWVKDLNIRAQADPSGFKATPLQHGLKSAMCMLMPYSAMLMIRQMHTLCCALARCQAGR